MHCARNFVKRPGRAVFEKAGRRGGGTAPPGPKRAEKPRFFCETTDRRFETQSVLN